MPVSAIERFANILLGAPKRAEASERRDPAAEPLWAETQPCYREHDAEGRLKDRREPQPTVA
jgi:hypothetical protein